VAALHASGKLHGDLKPDNILLSESGAVLIDSFEIDIGLRSPGWTPTWSAPEQVLGLALTPVADIYPLARMLGRAVGGEFMGEVRQYRVPRRLTGFESFEIIHNPMLFFEPDSMNGMSLGDARVWCDFVERSLRFDPEHREPATASQFSDKTPRTSR